LFEPPPPSPHPLPEGQKSHVLPYLWIIDLKQMQ
jgi:hypothetical protein